MNNLDKIYRVKPNYNEARLVKSGIRINEIPDEYKDKRILLVGDAEGVEKRLLEKRGFTNIVSTDLCYLTEGQRKLDIEKEVLPERFDLIFMSHILEHYNSLNKRM